MARARRSEGIHFLFLRLTTDDDRTADYDGLLDYQYAQYLVKCSHKTGSCFTGTVSLFENIATVLHTVGELQNLIIIFSSESELNIVLVMKFCLLYMCCGET